MIMTFAVFTDLYARGVILHDVVGYFAASGDRPMLLALRLEFADQNVHLIALDDDSIEIAAAASFDQAVTARSLACSAPWDGAISKPLLCAWQMTNQQGYFDGLQFDFAHTVADAPVRIQLLVVASEFKIQ
jgi:hypothetical protein